MKRVFDKLMINKESTFYKMARSCQSKLQHFLAPLFSYAVLISKRLRLKNPFIFLGVTALTIVLFFVLSIVNVLLPGPTPVLMAGKSVYLVLPLSLIGISYTVYTCSQIFQHSALPYWFPVFPLFFVI